jgi:hypothetical protein
MYAIVLCNSSGCELDRREVGQLDGDADVGEILIGYIRDRVIYPGDSIKISACVYDPLSRIGSNQYGRD